MNKLTRKIRNKGYSLLEFCEVYSISLRSYRRYEKEDHPDYWILVEWVDRLQSKGIVPPYIKNIKCVPLPTIKGK